MSSSTARTWPAILAVAAGWLAIMPSSILTLALRENEIDAPASQYSLILTAGWATAIAGTFVFGRLSDNLHGRAAATRVILIGCAAAIVLLNNALAETYSDKLLPVAWIALQIPVAAVVAIAMKFSARAHDGTSLSRASGYVGAAPALTLIIGSSIVTAVGDVELGFRVPAVIAVVMLLPFLVSDLRLPAIERPQVQRRSLISDWKTPWGRFLFAEFLSSSTVCAVTSYLVPYASTVIGTSDANLTAKTARALLIASASSILSSLLLGLRGRTASGNFRGYIAGTLLMTLGVATILVWRSITALTVGGAVIGLGFGFLNATELSLTKQLNPDDGRIGERLGIMTSVTTAPYVAVPATSAVLLATGAQSGLIAIFTVAAVASTAAMALMYSLHTRPA